jgi:hypothetical protein
MEEARVVVQHLEMQLVNVACDDPGIAIGGQLALPLLQERLDVKGKEHAAARAQLAESEIMRMEVRGLLWYVYLANVYRAEYACNIDWKSQTVWCAVVACDARRPHSLGSTRAWDDPFSRQTRHLRVVGVPQTIAYQKL